MHVWNAAVAKAYGGRRKIAWMEIYSGEKAADVYDGDYMPEETFEAMREYVVGIKGPLTTPVGGGFRSLNVTLRQVLDLYACVRPVRYIPGTPSPMPSGKNGHRSSSAKTPKTSTPAWNGRPTLTKRKLIKFYARRTGQRTCVPASAIGIKPVSEFGTKRLVRQAIQYAIDNNRTRLAWCTKATS
jgi:isocitrate dehydrogenase